MTTAVSAPGVRFRLADPPAEYRNVRLWLDLEHHVEPTALARVDGGWEVTIPRPPVLRLEYLFLVAHADGSEAMICDPENARRVATAFGDHSVLEFAEYRSPSWLDTDVPQGGRIGFAVPAPGLRRAIAVTVCSPFGADDQDPLPLLAVHDGPEFDQLAQITRWSAAMIASGRLPAHRVALLAPGDRNSWYAACADYAHAVRHALVPALGNVVGVGPAPVLAGASLGALAALHAVTICPGPWAGLFLQSGSFFRPASDAHERGFSGYPAITDFVRKLETYGPTADRLDIGMTVGLAEENLVNNREMAQSLTRLGHRVTLTEVPDAHTYTGWRDALDPHLTDLLARTWTGDTGAP
jgi:enterochelin esterase-like enzyme